MNNTTKANIFRRAAEIVAERGMCVDYYEDAEGRVCIKGAVRLALREASMTSIDEHWLFIDLTASMQRLGYTVNHPGYTSIDAAIWNNSHAKDTDDVAHALKLVAEDVELDA